MRFLREIILQITALFRIRNIAGEIDAEVAQHLEFATADFVEAGMSPEKARLAALRKFGNVEAHKERARDSWGTREVLDRIRDFKFGLRLCVRYPSSSIMAIVVLSIGIAMSVVMFTVSTKILDTDAFDDEKVVRVAWETGESYAKQISVLDFNQIREEATLLENVIGINHLSFWLPGENGEEDGEFYPGAQISTNVFDYVDASPLLGRLFLNTSEFREVLISESVWTGFFGRDEDVVGSSIVLNEEECKIVGVMPAGFALAGMLQVWVSTDWTEFEGRSRLTAPIIQVVGMLKKGVTIERAKTELDGIANRLAIQYPDTNEKYTEVRLDAPGERPILVAWSLILFGSSLVLGMTCVNAFNIMMTRTAKRTHELAARCALGAKRSHVLWQVIVDGVTLSGIGATIGIALAMAGLHFAANFLEGFDQPGLHMFRMSPWVGFFALAAAVISGVGSSLVPAWRASRMDPFALLKDDFGSSSGIYIGWLSKVTVVSQVAFSSIIIYFSVMLLFSSYALVSVNVTFDGDTVLAANADVWTDPNIRSPEDVLTMYSKVKRELESVPGVEAVALTSKPFGILGTGMFEYELEGQAEPGFFSWNKAVVTSVSPDYLKVFGFEPILGRMIRETDTADSELVCVVSEEFVTYRFNGPDPVGSRLKVVVGGDQSEWITIVGVVPGLKPVFPGAEEEVDRFLVEILFPIAQRINWSPTLLLHAANAANSSYRMAIRDTFEEVAPLVRLRGDVITLRERIDMGGRFAQGASGTSDVFGTLVLLMSLIGLYSIVSFTTSQRRKEFGIRIALGCPRWAIVYSVLKPWCVTIISGLVLASFILITSIGLYLSFIEEMSGLDSSTFSVWTEYSVPFLITAIVVSGTSLLAMTIPAWRSTRIDPMEVIRAE